MTSLKDISEAAGVSIRTVGRVLKGQEYVQASTRKTVVEAAKRLGYRPNRAAQALKTGRTFEIVAVLNSLDELHLAKLAALQEIVQENGYSVHVVFGHRDNSEPAIWAQAALSIMPAGVVIFPPYVSDAGNIKSLFPMPCVAIDADVVGVPCVHIDRPEGVYRAVRRLAASGRRRIAYMGRECPSRLDGYRRALAEIDLQPIELIVPETGSEYEAIRAAFEIFRHAAPDGVQVYSDVMAMGLLRCLHENGYRVPEDVAVVGFDDRQVAGLSWPPLTTVAQPNRAVGEAAGKMILEMIENDGETQVHNKVIPTKLIVRESALAR